MAIKITGWKYSGEKEQSWIPAEAGLRYLYIQDASYTEGEEIYTLNFQDLQNEARFTIKYWLNTSDKNNNIVPNSAARGTLISLGHSVLGTDEGIPFPDDIKGAVVCGEVVLKEYNGKTFPKIYKFTPVSSEWAMLGTIEEQYVEDYDDAEMMEDEEY